MQIMDHIDKIGGVAWFVFALYLGSHITRALRFKQVRGISYWPFLCFLLLSAYHAFLFYGSAYTYSSTTAMACTWLCIWYLLLYWKYKDHQWTEGNPAPEVKV